MGASGLRLRLRARRRSCGGWRRTASRRRAGTPIYAPDNPIASADIVNLGFVINVIEDFDERLEALTRAWSLAERLLVVSVMLANQNDVAGGALPRRGPDPARDLPEVLHPGGDQGVPGGGPGRGADPGGAGGALCVPGQGRGAALPGRPLPQSAQSCCGEPSLVAAPERPARPRRDRAEERYQPPIASRWSGSGRAGWRWAGRRRSPRSTTWSP